MEKRSRSTLFLMEQMIVIVVFAFCAAVCVKLIGEAHVISTRNNDIKNAIITVESAAECFKAFSGDMPKIAEILGGTYNEQTVLTVYYDDEWRISNQEEAVYIMSIINHNDPAKKPLITADIQVRRTTGDDILTLTVSVVAGANSTKGGADE